MAKQSRGSPSRDDPQDHRGRGRQSRRGRTPSRYDAEDPSVSHYQSRTVAPRGAKQTADATGIAHQRHRPFALRRTAVIEEHEGGGGHESSERWLVSYADFITLLFALFVLLYALSNSNHVD